MGPILLACLLLLSLPAPAAGLRLAVAANFAPTLNRILARYQARTGVRAQVATASTGTLYAQIRQGAPFDLFLAADARRPRRLEDLGLGLRGTRCTYAIGRLVLWSPTRRQARDGRRLLAAEAFRHLAIANPRTAPYGAAARQVLQRLGLWQPLQSRLVRGNSIAQTYQFVASGAAELGFVAASQLGTGTGGWRWMVPQALYRPLRQQAIVLRGGRTDQARAFLRFLRRAPAARRLIRAAGYRLPPPAEAATED